MPKSRKVSKLKPLRTLRIFCEGEKTEPNYIGGYIATLPNEERKAIIEVQKTRKCTAVQLVEEAIKLKRSPESLPDDEFWVVYDRESPAKYSDALHAQAYDKALKFGVNVAICNVCFEYWLLLHFIDTDAPYQSYDDLKKNSALSNEVRQLCGCDYEKSSPYIFDALKDKVSAARKRGERINKNGKDLAKKRGGRPFQINPYVGIVDLLQAMDDFY